MRQAVIPVESSVIAAVEYANRNLTVRFVSGRTYRYRGVPHEVFDGLLAAESKGGYFNLKILGRYRYAEIKETSGSAPRSAA